MKTIKKIGNIKIKINRKRLRTILKHLEAHETSEGYRFVTKILNKGFRKDIYPDEIEYVWNILLEKEKKREKMRIFKGI